MGYCQLPVRRDYWKLLKYNSYLPTQWMHGKLSCNKFDYIQRNIHLGCCEDEKVVDKEVSEIQDDGEFEPEEEEEQKVETVEKGDDDWGGEGIDANNNSDVDADSDCTIDVDTDVKGNKNRYRSIICQSQTIS